MIDKINRYEKKVLDFVSRYENILQKVISGIDWFVLKAIIVYEAIIFQLLDLLNKFGKIMRYSTYPFHWIWIKFELWQLRKADKLTDLPLFQLGAQYIYGKPEAGKSTLMYHAMMDYAYYTGKTSYTTTMMELPRKNLFGREYYYHQLFSPSEFYKDGTQLVQFNTDRHNIIVYEEMLTMYHQRDNTKKSYNDEVLPMIAAMGTQRHQGIDLFYFISQLPRNDIALMQMLRGYHEPNIKKAFDYKLWLETGKIRFYIKGWKIISHQVVPSGGNDYKLVNKKKWFYKNIYNDEFKYFNRLNMQKHFSNLAKHKGVDMA